MHLAIDGVRVGHWTDPRARTGCTVVVLPEGTVASGEVRGGAPATREVALLAPERLVDHVDAVVLTGGSAFGLAAADGVVQRLEAAGRGFPTAAGPVPIVVALGLFDLLVGDGSVRPGPAEGAAAYDAALAAPADGPVALGAVGAGAGATVGTWRGPAHVVPGGLGGAVVRDAELTVAALVAVNAFGDVVPVDHDVAASVQVAREQSAPAPVGDEALGANTTIGLVVTNAALDKAACHLIAQRSHDGLARAVVPAHTVFDGDAFVVAATGAVALDAVASSPVSAVEHVRLLAAAAVEHAVRAAVAEGDCGPGR